MISKKKFLSNAQKVETKRQATNSGFLSRDAFVQQAQAYRNAQQAEQSKATQSGGEKKQTQTKQTTVDITTGEKLSPGTNTAQSGKVSEQEYSRSGAMQQQYGSYENYLRGLDAVQGRALGQKSLQQQSAALTALVPGTTQKLTQDMRTLNERLKAQDAAQQAQERGMARTSQELGKQIAALEEQRANSHFQDYQYDENGNAYTVDENGNRAAAQGATELTEKIEALQQQKAQTDNQRALLQAQRAIGGLDDESRTALAQYNRGGGEAVQGGNGASVPRLRATDKKEAAQLLTARGYTQEQIERLAEYEQYLNDYETAQAKIRSAQEFGQQLPVASTVFSALLAPGKALGNLESVRGVLPSWAGGYKNPDMPTNIYSPLYGATQVSGGIRQGVMQDMGSVGQFLYQAGTSALDSAVNMAVSAGLVGAVDGVTGAAAQDAVAGTMNWVMGSEVAADSVYEGIQSGKSNTEALIDGIVEGAIEGITEKYSVGDIIENMLSGRAAWKKLLRSFASEGAEEIASNWLNRVYEVVAKRGRSEVMTAYANYIAQGKTQTQALAALAADFAKEDGLSFLAGGLSGLGMSGAYAGANRIILEANVAQTARAVVEAGQVQDVIDYGLAQKEDTKAHKLAEAMQKTVDAGEEVTVKDAENVLREVAEEQQAAVDEGEEPLAPEQLTRLEQMQHEEPAAEEQSAEQQTAQSGQKDSYQIYREAVQEATEAARGLDEMNQQYQQQEQQRQKTQAQSAAEVVSKAKKQAEQAKAEAEGSLLAPSAQMLGVEELNAEQYTRQQTQQAEQEMEQAQQQQQTAYLERQAQQAGYDESTTSYFMNGNVTGLPMEQYVRRFRAVYQQGQQGASWQYAQRYAKGMHQDVARAAYAAGLAEAKKGATGNVGQTVTGNGQGRNTGERGKEQASAVAEGTERKADSASEGRKRAQSARSLAEAWQEVSCESLGLGKGARGTVRVMPEGAEANSTDIRQAAKYLRSMGVKHARFFTGQLEQEIDGKTIYAEGAVLEDGTVLIRADSEAYSAFQLARHEGYHILADRYPAMAERIKARLMREGKITQQMLEGYMDAYHRAYGDDLDAYAEEILADAYAGMDRRQYTTQPLRMDVRTETGQWTKKAGSARAPPEKYSMAGTNARTADKNALRKAEKMQEEGASAEDIFRETGWYVGADGEWRFEIDDSGMEFFRDGDVELMKEAPYRRMQALTDKWAKNIEGSGEELSREEEAELEELQAQYEDRIWAEKYQLRDFIQHDKLFEAYPWLRYYSLIFKNMPIEEKGYYSPRDGAIVLNSDLIGDTRKTLIHEIQHIIQHKEGFSTGASPKYWNDRMEEGFTKKNAAGEEMLPGELYKNTAGEIEARDVANRLELSEAERKKKMPDVGNDETVFAEDGWQDSFDYDPETASIKEQIEKSRVILNKMEVVANVTVPTNLNNKASAAKWATEYLKKSGYHVDRKGYGEIVFSKKDIDKGLRYADTAEEKAALAVLPQVLKRGIKIEEHTNHKGREKQTITLAAPVKLNGKRGNMAAVVNKNGNHYYTHRIVTPEGKMFVFNKEDATQELSRGVTVSGSLADTTSAASATSISNPNKIVNTKFSAAAETEQQTDQEQEYVTNARTDLLRDLQQRTGIPYVWGAKRVKEQVDALIEAAQTGGITQEQIDAAFTGIWEAGKAMTQEFAEQYDDLLKTIRESAITPTEEERENIKDYDRFRSWAKGKIKLADAGGTSVEETYRGLSEQLPGVFPSWVSEKQMAGYLLRGVQMMQSAKNLAKSFQGSNSSVWEERAKADFRTVVREMARQLHKSRQEETYLDSRKWKPKPLPKARKQEQEKQIEAHEQREQEAQEQQEQREAREQQEQDRQIEEYEQQKQEKARQQQEAAPDYQTVLPKKAADYVYRMESRLVNELAENLSVPNSRQAREELHGQAKLALNAFFATGEVRQELLDELFEQAYAKGIAESAEYYNQYKDIRDFIRDTTITISEQDAADIADFGAFRRAAFGTMTIGKDGRAVDAFYKELRELAPELFPETVTAPSDQLLRILDAARSIKKTQQTLDAYYGDEAQAFKRYEKMRFDEAVQRLTGGLRIAQRYREAQEKAAEKLAVPKSAEEAAQLWPELKKARRTYERVQRNELLTKQDMQLVNGLLRGQTTTEYVRTLENGRAIIQAYEAKAEFDLLALRLKAWNIQRKQELREQAEQALTEAEAVRWKDKKAGIQYARETMERNVRDIARKGKVDDEKSQAFIDRYFTPVHKNESRRKNYILEQQEKIRALNLSQKVEHGNLVSESYAVQWLGEAEFNAEYLRKHPRTKKRGGMEFDEWQAAIQKFEQENPKMDMGKIRRAVKVFHQVYDELFQEMNRVRVENGYEPVDYTFGYFPHFQENDQDGSLLQRFARALGVQGDVTPLPTTINGLTAMFKPGIRYMGNIQKRLGYATAYDALKGMDLYLETASDVIFHTEDIQRLRSLATQIRYRSSDEGIQKQIDAIVQDPYLSPEKAHDEVESLTKEAKFALAGFVDELDEYTNLLAGKKSRLDRGMEKLAGRDSYNVMKKFESRVGANMVAANIGSALTNFIPITQAWAQTSTVDILSGMWQTVKNMKQADGLDSMSSFINNRSGYDRLNVTSMDKASAIAGWLMEEVDQITTGSVVRARYLNNLKRGMSETNAMDEADQFAAAIMADRSKGSTPTLYSSRSPLVKLFTQFQLEVNNELSWIFKDLIPAERKKGVLALTKALFKFMIGAWLYNEIYEYIVGRRAALDPLDMINDTVGDFTGYHLPNTVQAGMNALMRGDEIDFTTEKKKTPDAIAGLEGRLLSELPGTQALTMLGVDESLGIEIDNGRIAVASAIPDLGELRKAVWSSKEDLSGKKRASILVNELAKPVQYVALPFGGGQLNKMARGALATTQGGSYKVDNEGNEILQYPVYNDTTGRTAASLTQSLLFGKTATEAAREWVESGFRSLNTDETAAYEAITDAGEDQRKTYAFILAEKDIEKAYDKKMLLKTYAISDEAKAEYYYQVLAGEDQQEDMEPLDTQGRIEYMYKAISEAQSEHERAELREQVLAGSVTQEKAIQKLVANDWAKDENDAYWKWREWTGGEGYKKYDAYLDAVEAGEDAEQAAEDYLEHGVEAKTLASQITTRFKPLYRAADEAERKRLKKLILDALVALGYDREERGRTIDKWLDTD